MELAFDFAGVFNFPSIAGFPVETKTGVLHSYSYCIMWSFRLHEAQHAQQGRTMRPSPLCRKAPMLTILFPACRLTGGMLGSATKLVQSSKCSHDEKLAAELWDVSAEFAKLPKEPKI